jgi:hypothetical protein
VEPVSDAWALGQLKQQAREILAEAALLALALTAIALLLPGPSA